MILKRYFFCMTLSGLFSFGCTNNSAVLRSIDQHTDCLSKINGHFHSNIRWKTQTSVLILRKQGLQLRMGNIISRDENGVTFDAEKRDLLLDPKPKYYRYSEVQALVNSDGEISYGSIPDKYLEAWKMSIVLHSADKSVSPFCIKLQPNQPFSICLEPGKYEISEITLEDDYGNSKTSLRAPRIDLIVEEERVTTLGDIYLVNSYFNEGNRIKSANEQKVTIHTNSGGDYVYVFQEIRENPKIESWYSYWALGYPNIHYSKSYSEYFDQPVNTNGLSHNETTLDSFGFFFPKGKNTVVGFVINGFWDEYEHSFGLRGITYGFSVMHFLNSRIGKGPFFRGDIGLTKFGHDGILTFGESSFGPGASAGIGYGIPVSKGTRILLNVGFDAGITKDMSYGNLEFSVGGLF